VIFFTSLVTGLGLGPLGEVIPMDSMILRRFIRVWVRASDAK
jgi:hypothetical protein